MAEQQITPGTKLQVAFDVPMGQKTDFNMLATYKENLDDAYFLMSAPMLAGNFVKRRDERFKVAMRLTYQRDNAPTTEPEDAMTIDVSAGGLAVYLNDYPDVGEALSVQMPTIRLQGERHELPEQLGIVCWVRRAPKGSLYRNVCGLQFRYADDMERELVKEYVGYIRTKYKI